MQSIRPKTYNELMLYRRCLQLRSCAPEIDDTALAGIYRHMVESKENTIDIVDGKLVFYKNGVETDSFSVTLGSIYRSVHLSASALSIQHLITSSGGDSGISGNNNNNNNNNNNG